MGMIVTFLDMLDIIHGWVTHNNGMGHAPIGSHFYLIGTHLELYIYLAYCHEPGFYDSLLQSG